MATDTDAEDIPAEDEKGAGEAETPKLSLTLQVAEPSACERHITVTISRDDIERYFKDKFDELLPEAEVPGFRKGRAPRKLVESKFRHQVSDQVKGSLLMDSIAQVSDEKSFSAISEPDFDFDAIDIPDEGPMTYEFDLEVRPEFDMPQWKKLSLDQPTRKFTKKDIDAHLKNLLNRHSTLVPHDGPAEAGDYVTVNIAFEHDGKVLSKGEEQSICIRPSLSFRDGTLKDFESLMVGVTEGDSKEAKIKVSASAEDVEMQGKEVDAKFDVLDVKQVELPELTDELLQSLGGFENEGDLRDGVQQELERQLSYHQNKSVREQITAQLTEAATWELPPELLKRQAHRELERSILELQRSGFNDDQIQAYANDLRQNSLASTATSLKEHFILERIAEEENIEDLPEDYDQEIALIAYQQGESPRRVRAQLEKRGMMDTLRNQIIERKAIDLITAEATFKEVKFKLPGNDTEAVDIAICGTRKESNIPEAKPEGVAGQLPTPVDHS